MAPPDLVIHRATTAVTIATTGAMVTFTVTRADGGVMDPLFRPHWTQAPGDPLLGHMRGDFLCVPFGMQPDPQRLPEPWRAHAGSPTAWPHGYAAAHEWQVVAATDSRAHLALKYPQEDDVASVTCLVVALEDGIEVTDTITVRRAARLPLGLHPILRLPTEVGAARLVLPGARSLRTQPVPPEPSSLLKAGAVFHDLAAAPLAAGGTDDLTHLPLAGAREEIILIDSPAEPLIRLINEAERYEVSVEWDARHLRSCMLWVSNRGRPFAPWDGRNTCLGVEPVTAAFDYGTAISRADNPLTQDGIATTATISPARPVVLRHRIRVTPLP
ncbi:MULTISPECIES: hypothetical protein [unclassified Actinomyces]|uniref:hypothetical protein n=1 Tax=unclassified Actinomyces TaxID=2609248 RepID=UPI002016E4DC|nr:MULTISPECIES: hypothetical protein [unclassified Actinomyces]MCL3778134.1 hypothetical protein [Actinomyces sp. AC-20-1]MCL3789411.1 hypothetical protein [Actinomyces sp. 187325]MCL3791732.1 hypothetical protein [Actinomyces sp. 186855]MCL3794384.1 hypothetical protein [Actinomyces sp. 217892]